MPRHPSVYEWNDAVATHFPSLSKPLPYCLAAWTLGMMDARSCALTAVAKACMSLLGQKFDAALEHLRDLYREGSAKKGDQRAELDLNECWAPWLAWVLDGWSGQQVALAQDATTLGRRFSVLVVSVVYRGSAVPVSWQVLAGNKPHLWKPEWISMLHRFRKQIPESWKVLVLSDRGLYAPWLYQEIVGLGWHPLMRINRTGKYQPAGWKRWRSLSLAVTKKGRHWRGRATVFKTRAARLERTLLAWWGEGRAEPWLIVTDLPLQAANTCWYGMRVWIEHGFKEMKSGGLNWQATRIENPERADRHLLAIAVATWWLLSARGAADESVPKATMGRTSQTRRRHQPEFLGGRPTKWRLMAIPQQGWIVIMTALLHHLPLPTGVGHPEPWPERMPDGSLPWENSDDAARRPRKTEPRTKNLQL